MSTSSLTEDFVVLTDTPEEEPVKTTKKKGGRPSKKAITANKKGSRGAVGRPKGDAAKMNEYKAMMLTSPKSRHVLQKIMDAALDDEHKNQSAAWKLIVDRIVPVGMFDKEAKSSSPGVQINVSVVGDASIDTKQSSQSVEDSIEGEYEEIQEAVE